MKLAKFALTPPLVAISVALCAALSSFGGEPPADTYTKIDFLESTGKQYIKTGVFADPTTVTTVDFQYTDLTTQQRLLGADGNNALNLSYSILIGSDGKFASSIQDGAGDTLSSDVTADTARHTAVLNAADGTFSLDGAVVSPHAAAVTKTASREMFLFASDNSNGGVQRQSKVRIYSVRIEQGGETVRDLVPCYVKTTLQLGLYDRQNDIFYPNGNTSTTDPVFVAPRQVVYVKPTACGTADGSSWANALGSVSNALVVALKRPAPREVHMAKGMHRWLSAISIGRDIKGVFDPDVSGGYSFAIRGGYAGVSEDELPDIAANPTWLNCDVNGDDRWVKYSLGDFAYTGSSTAVDCGKMVDDDGEVVFPDDTDDPDALYCIDSTKAGDNACFLDLQDNGTDKLVEISGLNFLGAGMARQYVSRNSFINAISAAVTMKDVTFLGGNFSGSNGVWTMIKPDKTVIIDNVKFLWSTISRLLLSVGGITGDTLRNVQVKGLRATGSVQNGAVFWCNPMTSCTVVDCQFEKLYGSFSHGGYGQPGGVFGFENGSGCLISNCVFRQICTRGTDTAAAIDFRRRDSSKTMKEMRVVNCLFEKNVSYATGTTVNNLGIVMLAGNGVSLEDCTFKDNEIVVKPTGVCKVACAATVTVGASRDFPEADVPRRMLVNCTFSGNDVKADTGSNSEETTPRCFSRGVLLNAAFPDTPIDLVVADCTFVDGDSALPHVRWTGVDTTYPISVVNSYFHGDAANGYVPFLTAEANMIEVDNCLMNGPDVLPGVVVGDVNAFMELPVGAWDDQDGELLAPVRRIGANVAPLRSGLPLNSFVDGNVTYLTDAGGNHIYRSATVAVPATAAALADAVGAPRPADATTIGAVQALTEKAENGATLYVEVSPKEAGTLSGGGTVQVVDKGEGIVEITATSSDPSRYTFEGWKLPDGTVYSDAATLTISKLDDNLQLTASFSAPKVTYTFNLGAAGTFVDSGESTAVLELSPGEKLTVPAFTIDEEKVVPYGWDVTPPATVGMENQTFIYQYLEKVYRIVRVDASAADGGDGSTWANAMNDIQAAIDLAGAWQGEVWIRQGVHRIGKTVASYLTMKKNVQILGGFEGVDGKYDDVEAERAARNPEAFRSVLTGDINLDDVWQSTETGPSADMRDETNGVFTVVGADGKFRMPEFKSGRICYGHRSPTANADVIFDNADVALDATSVLDGVTLTGAPRGIDNGKGAHPVVRNCTFMGAAKYLSKTWITCQNCQFIAVGMGQIAVDETTVMRFYEGDANGDHTILDGCTFKYCYGASRGIVVFQAGNYYFEAKGCLFEQCTGSSSLTRYYGTTFGCEQCTGFISGVTIRNCWNTTGAALALFPQSGSVVVTNCLFEGNSVVQNKGGASSDSTGDIPSAIVTTASDAGTMRLYNCTFRNNEVDRTTSTHVNSKNAQAAVVYLKGKDGSSLVNCTFDGNTVTCTSQLAAYPAKSSVVLVRQIGTTVAKAGVANCTFVNNAAADGDIYLADRTGTTPFYLVNTICWGGEGHKAVTASGDGNAELYAWNSIVHGLDAGASFVADVTACATTSPGAMRKWTESELAPHFAKAVGGSSAAVKGGRNVYADAKNVICVPTDAGETAFVNLATGAAVTPSGAKALISDVFGNARTAGEVTMGAFEGRYADGLRLIVR